MRTKFLASIVLTAFTLAGAPAGLAFETDQYNLSPEPLADIGGEFAVYVDQQIRLAIDDLNAQIAVHASCVDTGTERPVRCGSPEAELKKLEELHSPDALAAAVYARLGKGNVFTSSTGKWLNEHKFAHEPSRYKTSYSDSIFVPMPIDYATLSPTIRMFGSEFGTDKMDHFFQQGYKYYQMYEKALADGAKRKQAEQEAVKWGQKTERLFFGMLISGVYSNADLFANFAGMKFYLRLADQVALADGKVLYPVVRLNDSHRWSLNESYAGADALIKPFISDHLNEALNPSGYSFLLFPTVKKVVKKKACSEWRDAFPDMTREKAADRTAVLETWDGEDYGFTRKSKTVTLAATCF